MTIRWGIIGCGDVCEVKSGPPLYNVPGSALRIVMRRNGDAARDFAQRHGVPSHTNDANVVVKHPEVDAVYIATPPGTHMEYALLVAESGKPCYVEKPMARSAVECERMVEAFERASLPLFVAYYRRMLPRFVQVAHLIQSGELGHLMTVQYLYQGERRHRAVAAARRNWRERAEDSGGGLFLDLGSHVLDILDYLLGPLSDLHGQATRRSGEASVEPGTVEDTVCASFSSASGVPGTCMFAFHTTRFVDQLTLIGSAGTLTLSVFGSEPLTLTTEAGIRELAVAHPKHVQYPLVETIVSELSGGPLRCPSTGRSALRTSRAMDQILSDYYGGRADEFWARPSSWPRLSGRRP